jgi:hypothetical protein
MFDSTTTRYVVRRISFISTKSAITNKSIVKKRLNGDQNLVDYKALSRRSGLTRKYDVKVGLLGTHSPIGQAAQSIGSVALPGNLSPLRSPVRSGGWRAITPGKPNIPGRTPGGDGVSRCPEGYQYGGRFTDNRLSTCGAKLFDLPSPLGLAIGALRRVARGAIQASRGESTPITGQAMPESIVQSRRPQIPRVGNENRGAVVAAARNLVSEIGRVDKPVARMVRRDGFVLEPVVSAQVLRAIPDNRDMEGATYLLSVQSADQMGGQELGLLSNTGITKLTYVMPGGSQISLEKKRPLTVGERRKLGRTVNSAAKIDISNDPTARLKEVVNQTGDGIGYSENFVNIKNPNESVSKNGRTIPRWADELFGKGKKAKPIAESSRETDSESQIGKQITDLDRAVALISEGGKLSDIDPGILGQAISRSNAFKVEKLDAKRSIVSVPNGPKYILHSPSGENEHIGQRVASDFQQFLGLESPDVFFVGTGSNRKYMVEDPGSIIRGYEVDRRKKFTDYEPEDVAKMLVSDWITDQRVRDPGSIVPVSNGEITKPVVTNNYTSALTDLDKIKIRERTRMTINDFMKSPGNDKYLSYFQQLKKQQQLAFRREIDALLLRARKFNFTQLKSRMYNDGKLSGAEKAHLEIVGQIIETRISVYENSKNTLLEIFGALK